MPDSSCHFFICALVSKSTLSHLHVVAIVNKDSYTFNVHFVSLMPPQYELNSNLQYCSAA